MTLLAGARARGGLLLFLASVLVYNANMREVSSVDTLAARLLPVAVIREQSLTLDGFFRDHPAGAPLPYGVEYQSGHYRLLYPALPALLAVPVYFVPIGVFGGGSWGLINLLAKVSAALFAAASVLLVYLAARELGGDATAGGAALVYAFATSTWSVSSQGLWGHGPAEMFLAAAIYFTLRGEAEPTFVGWAGAASGLMVGSRQQTAFLAAALLAYAFHRRWRDGVRCLSLFALALLPVFLLEMWRLGSVQGPYADIGGRHAKYAGGEGMWLTPLGEGLVGLLLSPSRGLLVYSPVLLFAFAGMAASFSNRRRHLFHYLALGFVATLLAFGKYSFWWGGHSFGPRYVTDVLPILAMFLVPVWTWVEGSKLAKLVFVGLFAISVSIQAIGAFYYPSPPHLDWNTSPRDVDVAPDRLWDWSDTQLLRLLRNGPHPPGFGPLG